MVAMFGVEELKLEKTRQDGDELEGAGTNNRISGDDQ